MYAHAGLSFRRRPARLSVELVDVTDDELARPNGNVAFVGDPVGVAVGAGRITGAIGDVAFVGDAVNVAVAGVALIEDAVIITVQSVEKIRSSVHIAICIKQGHFFR